MTDEQMLDKIGLLLSIISKQNERIDILSQRIDTANERIDVLRESVEYNISLTRRHLI